jgi:hypothetical protein
MRVFIQAAPEASGLSLPEAGEKGLGHAMSGEVLMNAWAGSGPDGRGRWIESILSRSASVASIKPLQALDECLGCENSERAFV